MTESDAIRTAVGGFLAVIAFVVVIYQLGHSQSAKLPPPPALATAPSSPVTIDPMAMMAAKSPTAKRNEQAASDPARSPTAKRNEQAASDLAKMGMDFAAYQEVCDSTVPVPVWDFLLASINKYGADKEAARQEGERLRADRRQYGDGKFCAALTKSVNVVVVSLQYMMANPTND